MSDNQHYLTAMMNRRRKGNNVRPSPRLIEFYRLAFASSTTSASPPLMAGAIRLAIAPAVPALFALVSRTVGVASDFLCRLKKRLLSCRFR